MKTYDKYKSSGIDWIGDIPEHWELKKLKYWINSTLGGGTPSTGNSNFWNGNIPWVSPKDMKTDFITKTEDYITELAVSESATNLIPPDRILIVVRSGILKHTLPVAINKVEVSLNQDMKAFEPKANLLSRFLFWKLKGQSSDILTLCNKIGATVDSIEMEDLFAFPFALPPISEQTAIADYLDEKTAQTDKLIAEKRRLIELLKEERLGVINQAVTRGINPHAKLKPSGIAWLGDIPEHWEVKKLKYVLDCFNTIRIPLNADERGSEAKIYDYYGASGVIDKVGSYLFDGEYILIGEDGANLLDRNSPLAFKATGKFWVNNHAHILKPISDDIDYFTYLLESIDYTIWISGSAQPKLTVERLLNVPLWFPQIEEQKQIVEFIETATGKIDATIATIEKEIGFLREYRTALISEVVTGKIKVTDN